MKKKNLKSLKLNKKSISILDEKQLNGGNQKAPVSFTQEWCDISIPFTACISWPFHNC